MFFPEYSPSFNGLSRSQAAGRALTAKFSQLAQAEFAV